MTRSDLATATYEWSMQWWDHDEHMVWNPPGSIDPGIEARKLHLVPNTAWLAYAQLANGDDAAGAEAHAAIRVLIDLQYDRPGTVVHGTYRRFLEWPEPPAEPVMWDDYDPNWRQFVGTTLALVLEDFSDRLDDDLIAAIDGSIGLACAGEADGRIPPSYSNPALMRAWLDGWYGRRIGDETLVSRGRAFAERIVADFDRFGAFAEFNSPTYYGIDLYALRLWQMFAPDPYFATHGARLERAVWRSAGALYNANLRNFCGPFTRSYHPDATRSVTMFSLWIWAVLGREYTPLPSLDAPIVDHGHDLMAGAVFDRLTRGSAVYDLADFRTFGETHSVAQELARGRHVSAWVGPELMIGAESSGIDWGGWSQFMPATAHWRTACGQAVLWMVDAHEVHAVASDHRLRIDVPAGVSELRFRLISNDAPNVEETAVTTAGMRVTFGADIARVALTGIGTDAYEIRATAATSIAGIRADIRFAGLSVARGG
jgi:hypothetical protein